MLAPGQHTGVGTYARALERAQARLAENCLVLGDRPSLRHSSSVPSGRPLRWLRGLWPRPYRAVQCTDGPPTLLFAPDIFRVAHVHFDIYGKLLELSMPGPPGIFHWTYPIPLRIREWINLYTVHDVIPLTSPDLSPIDQGRHRRLLARIAATCNGIVTVSDASATEISKILSYPLSRIHNCGQAVDISPSSAALPADLSPGRYLLALGSIERRKNLDGLAKAYRLASVEMPLVIAGPDGWGAPELREPGIIRLPYLAEPDLRALLARARALVMPSLAEGFGLPVIEAMALGTPVITTRGGALDEVAGGAALLVDPHDLGEIATALRRLIEDDLLHARLSKAGVRNAERFTPDIFTGKLANLYANLASCRTADPHRP